MGEAATPLRISETRSEGRARFFTVAGWVSRMDRPESAADRSLKGGSVASKDSTSGVSRRREAGSDAVRTRIAWMRPRSRNVDGFLDVWIWEEIVRETWLGGGGAQR